MSTTSAIKVYPNPILRQGPTCYRTRHLCPSQQISNQTFPVHRANTTLLRMSFQPNHSHWSQCNCIYSSQRQKSVLYSSHKLLDYVATNTNSDIWYHAHDTNFALDTDSSHLSVHCVKIRPSAYIFLTNKNQQEFYNSDIIILSEIIKHVMSSTSK